ncbi:MAG: hypothetical protein RIT26_219, partial [Pseudomonadota bacterium]
MLVSQSSFKWRQANWRHIQILYGWFFFLCLAPAAWAQWAPTGYTGTINTPTADVLPLGGVSFGLSDNIPESKRVYPGTGYFGSTGLGLGVLPGLELSTRLAYDGDPDCDQRLRNCHAQSRDLSVGGKYRLPIDLPLQGRVALGFSDYGGSATQFRQNYGVWTSTWRDLDLSLGWGHIVKRNALLNGPFASATWRVSDQWRLSYESVREQKRAGVLWSYPLTPAWQWSMGYSRRLGANSPRQLHQMQLQLSYAFDRDSAPARVAAFSPYAPSG